MASPSDTPPTHATRLLQQSQRDDDAHGAELLELVGTELRQLAAAYLRRERSGHTLQPTALVHEAYIKLIDSTVLSSGDRVRFLGVAARAMRQVLVDFARRRRTARRGGQGWNRVSLHPDLTLNDGAAHEGIDLTDLDDALTRFAALHEKAARVVELRYFGGLPVEDVALAMGLSTRMVVKYWRTARAWLRRDLGPAGPS
jgi:RNA polymerase sigma-70 factor (ECF subfamily)